MVTTIFMVFTFFSPRIFLATEPLPVIQCTSRNGRQHLAPIRVSGTGWNWSYHPNSWRSFLDRGFSQENTSSSEIYVFTLPGAWPHLWPLTRGPHASNQLESKSGWALKQMESLVIHSSKSVTATWHTMAWQRLWHHHAFLSMWINLKQRDLSRAHPPKKQNWRNDEKQRLWNSKKKLMQFNDSSKEAELFPPAA